jgi:hypothetical protein
MFTAWGFVSRVVRTLIFTACGILALVEEAPWLNMWLRGGLVVMCVTYAAFPCPSPNGLFERLLKLSFVRSLQVRYAGFTLAALLIAMGLLVKNNAGAYLGAYIAVALAWFSGSFVRSLRAVETSKPKKIAAPLSKS